MPPGSGPIAVSPPFFGKMRLYSSQSIAIDSAWRSLRFLACCSGVSPLPTTGSSQLKPRYQLEMSTVRGSWKPFSVYSRVTSSESCISIR